MPQGHRVFRDQQVEQAFREIMDALTPDNTNETPISRVEWILFNQIRSAAEQDYDSKVGSVRTPIPALDRVGVEFSFSSYVRRWKQNALRPGQNGRGVSVHGLKVEVYTGERRGLTRVHFDVTDETGPWNAETRIMFGEIKSYLGRGRTGTNVIRERILRQYGNTVEAALLDYARAAAAQEVVRPQRSSLPAEDLQRAQDIVKECRDTGEYVFPPSNPRPKSIWKMLFG